jgi:hypothetical protein
MTTYSFPSLAAAKSLAPELASTVVSFRYAAIPDGEHPRPYVQLDLRGPNGQPLRVAGLIDTGADYSTLPLAVARQLGVSLYDLETIDADEVSGSVELGVAQGAVLATLAGNSFALEPRYVMVEGSDVGPSNLSWGRRDFLRSWDLSLSERDKVFTLARRF